MGNQYVTQGYRIVKVEVNSPAYLAKLEDYFDFIVGTGEQAIQNADKPFNEIIKEHQDKELILKIFNTRTSCFRDVTVFPNNKWGGNGLLGTTIRFENFTNTESQGVRVLEVLVNSPAAIAKLVPFDDYILGTKQYVFKSAEHFSSCVASSRNQEMELFVYNKADDKVRTALLTPNPLWGGRGMIGCDVGDGVFNRIPSKKPHPGSKLWEQSSVQAEIENETTKEVQKEEEVSSLQREGNQSNKEEKQLHEYVEEPPKSLQETTKSEK